MEGCCKEAKPASGAPSERRPEPWLKGCHRRLYAEEAILQFQGQCLGVPRLRPDQLGALVAYYHHTGDVLPNMVEIQEGLLSRKVDGLEMCAPSMMLARLLEVERDSISLPPMETRLALTNLRIFWERLEEGFGVSPISKPGAPPLGPGHEVPWLLSGPAGDWLNVTRSSIRNSFMRIDSQAKELESLAVYRKKHGFKVNVVLPVCGDKDDTHLDELERVVLQETRPLKEVLDLYIYDVCFAFCESAAYGLQNEVELELDLQSGSERPGSPYALLDLPPPLLRVARYFRRAFVVPFFEEMATGEVAPNLHHVARHYDDLPDFMMILHPDGYEHIPILSFVALLNSLALRLFPDVGFLHLGRRFNVPVDASGRVGSEIQSYCRMRVPSKGSAARRSVFRGDSFLERYTMRTPSGRYCQWVEVAWELLFDRPPQLPEDDYGGYDFAQYIASRRAAESRPKAFWQNAWRSLCSASNYQLLLGTKFISWKEITDTEGKRRLFGFHKGLTTAFEHLYHVIFNPEAKTWRWPTRPRNPSLPLGLKLTKGGLGVGNLRQLRAYRWAPHQPL